MSNAATVENNASQQNPPAAKIGVGAVLVPVVLSTVLTLATVGGGVYYLVHSGKLGAAGIPAPVEAPKASAPLASHVLAMEPMIVNLSDPGGRSYLRASISLRIQDEDAKDAKKEEKKDPKASDSTATELRDTTLAVLSSQTSEGMLAPEGRENLKHALEGEFKKRNPQIFVLEVYFTDFLVQR